MRLAIIFGGVSFEHEISIVSAISVNKIISSEKVFIFCDKNKDFFLIEQDFLKAKYFSSGEYIKAKKLILKKGGFFAKSLFGENKIDFDVALNLIHGASGEDGTISALFDFFEIPYIGSRIEGSVLSFNKLYTKYLAKQVGVKTLDFEVITRQNQNITLSYPFIIKPLRGGSSLGISIVHSEDELEYGLDCAYEYDDALLLEPFVEGIKEYNQAGFLSKDGFVFSLIEEPIKEKFLDFDKKYKDFSRTDKILKADISEEVSKKIQQAFEKIYNPLFKGSMIRCDFFVIENEVYLNEINPNPGSMANYLYDDFNLALNQIVTNLPKKQYINIDYSFIHEINSAKGKA